MPETKCEGTFVPIKKYEDGSTGDYYCQCATCGGRFIGHKLDKRCPRPHPE